MAPRQEPSRLLFSDLQALYANGTLWHPGRRTFFLQQLLSRYLEQRTFGKVKDNDLLVLIGKNGAILQQDSSVFGDTINTFINKKYQMNHLNDYLLLLLYSTY